MKIKLYCPKNSTSSALKSKLESTLAELRLPNLIEEINESVEFLRAGDLSFPVIRVLDNVIIHDDKATIDDTVKRVKDELLKEGHYILVPVDFTPESLHALRYARLVASALKMGITIAHIHEPIVDMGIVGDFDGEMKRINCDKLEKMRAEVALDQCMAAGKMKYRRSTWSMRLLNKEKVTFYSVLKSPRDFNHLFA